jgi:hypothetical protein
MSNLDEYLPIITKLLAKTKAGRVEWKGTFDSTTFICALEGEYSFEVERGKNSSGVWFCKLTMRDSSAADIFVLRAFAPTQTSSQQNDETYQVLDDVYDSARRIALDIDKKLADVSDILDKI